MIGSPPASLAQKALDVALIHGCSGPPDLHTCIPAGHCVSRARLHHLRESEWIVVTDGAVPVALAAYKRADGEIRVVHELLLDRTLAGPYAAAVTDVLLSALEFVAYDDGVRCLTFLLRCSVVMEPFEQRGYTSLVIDSCTWLQRKLGWLGWSEMRSDQPQ
jgi:hypothetical protein